MEECSLGGALEFFGSTDSLGFLPAAAAAAVDGFHADSRRFSVRLLGVAQGEPEGREGRTGGEGLEGKPDGRCGWRLKRWKVQRDVGGRIKPRRVEAIWGAAGSLSPDRRHRPGA